MDETNAYLPGLSPVENKELRDGKLRRRPGPLSQAACAARQTRKTNPQPALKIRRQYRRQPGRYRASCSNHPTTVNNPG